MDPSTGRDDEDARRELAESEQRWRELSAELDAAEQALRAAQRPEGTLITPEIFEGIELAWRRLYKVQAAMLEFLDTLDNTPP
jgi:hypothetical protein